jgi:type 1 glutamine amidotransferase
MRWAALLSVLITVATQSVWANPLNVLILSGQNNHDWQETTPVLRHHLEQSGRFSVEELEQPETMTADSLARFDVIVSNWNTFVDTGVKEWPASARSALIDFVRSGKGFVSVHAGSSSFYDWDDYQDLVITSWKEGQTDHGPQHTFRVTPTADQNPITQGVEPFNIYDELWHRAPLKPGAKILATAFSSKDNEGTGRDEPVLLGRAFGKGRSVNLLLGHEVRAMKHASFGLLFARSTEWAATGSIKPSALMPPGPEDQDTSPSQHKSKKE